MVASVYVISGTPGTGKTTVGQMLSEEGYPVMNLQQFAIEHECQDGFDEIRDSVIIDEDKLHDKLVEFLEEQEGDWIIEGHYGDLVPEHFVIQCFILTADLKELRKRLASRNYSKEKIEENIEAEIMKECWITALDSFGEDRVIEISPLPQEEVFEVIRKGIM